MHKAVCPGSFDPVTNGHLDIVARASKLYDEVTIAVMVNKSKKGLFTLDERMEMVRETTIEYGNVVVESFGGLLVDFCRERDIPVVIKGLRAVRWSAISPVPSGEPSSTTSRRWPSGAAPPSTRSAASTSASMFSASL